MGQSTLSFLSSFDFWQNICTLLICAVGVVASLTKGIIDRPRHIPSTKYKRLVDWFRRLTFLGVSCGAGLLLLTSASLVLSYFSDKAKEDSKAIVQRALNNSLEELHLMAENTSKNVAAVDRAIEHSKTVDSRKRTRGQIIAATRRKVAGRAKNLVVKYRASVQNTSGDISRDDAEGGPFLKALSTELALISRSWDGAIQDFRNVTSACPSFANVKSSLQRLHESVLVDIDREYSRNTGDYESAISRERLQDIVDWIEAFDDTADELVVSSAP